MNTYCVIMAGGIGSRFWPMSRATHPKQFLDILGTGETLIQQTFNRHLKICPKENIFIVTNSNYKELVLEQLPQIKPEQVLLEPARRNTAPCIAYAMYKIAALNPNANVIVAPSDHLILKQEEYLSIIQAALNQTGVADCLVTLGIKPTRPDTGYGYIQFDTVSKTSATQVKKVKTFTEKPDHDLAEKFLDSGDFYWNSGIFVWNVISILKAFEKYLPEVNSLFKEGIDFYNTPGEEKFISGIYGVCPNISIDYGVMEKANNAFVVLSDFGWSDLGTWGSLYTHLKKDKNENAVIGKKVMMYDSKNCIVNIPDNKRVVLQGLDGYIVVESDVYLLVCKREDEQKIKQFVNDIKTQRAKEKQQKK